MKNRIKSSSLIIQGGKFIYSKCSPFFQHARWFYSYSHTHKRIKNFKEKIKLYTRTSLPGRLTEINKTTLIDSNSSRTIQKLARVHQRFYSKKTSSLKHSSILGFIKRTKKKPSLSSAGILCMILITAVTTNVAFSFVLDKSISLWGWIIRGIIFFTAIITLFSNTSMSATKKSSCFLKKLRLD